MFKTEFEAHRALIKGEITLTQFEEIQERISAELNEPVVIAGSPLKNFLISRDADIANDFTEEDLDNWMEDGCYFRFQCKDWEVGEVSFGMVYSTPEEAIEEGSTVLDGKSCCKDWRDLSSFWQSFGSEDFVVMVFKGSHSGWGHDGEDVVRPEEFVKALDFDAFVEIADKEV